MGRGFYHEIYFLRSLFCYTSYMEAYIIFEELRYYYYSGCIITIRRYGLCHHCKPLCMQVEECSQYPLLIFFAILLNHSMMLTKYKWTYDTLRSWALDPQELSNELTKFLKYMSILSLTMVQGMSHDFT